MTKIFENNPEFVPLPGFEDIYVIDRFGNIFSIDRRVRHSTPGITAFKCSSMITHRVNYRGYKIIQLNREGRKHTRLVHRLIAQAFIDNPASARVVNHINGVKADNRIENLEWVSDSENQRHAYAMGLRKPSNQYSKRCAEEESSLVK